MKKVQRSKQTTTLSNEQRSSSYHDTRIHSNFVALCHSPHDSEISKFICSLLSLSIDYYLQNILQSSKQSDLLCRQFHKNKIANLIMSLRQEVLEKNVGGCCSFGLIYSIMGKLYCFRTEGVEMFLIDEETDKIWSLNGCAGYENGKRPRSKNTQYNYFSMQMPKLKAQLVYDPIGLNKKAVLFELILLEKYKSPKSNLKVLIGCCQTFDSLSPEMIFRSFKENSMKTDQQKAAILLSQVKKKLRVINNEDLSLDLWKINQRFIKKPISNLGNFRC